MAPCPLLFGVQWRAHPSAVVFQGGGPVDTESRFLQLWLNLRDLVSFWNWRLILRIPPRVKSPESVAYDLHGLAIGDLPVSSNFAVRCTARAASIFSQFSYSMKDRRTCYWTGAKCKKSSVICTLVRRGSTFQLHSANL